MAKDFTEPEYELIARALGKNVGFGATDPRFVDESTLVQTLRYGIWPMIATKLFPYSDKDLLRLAERYRDEQSADKYYKLPLDYRDRMEKLWPGTARESTRTDYGRYGRGNLLK